MLTLWCCLHLLITLLLHLLPEEIMKTQTTPELVLTCKDIALEVIALERTINLEYKKSKKLCSSTHLLIKLNSFKELYGRIRDMYPEYLYLIPKVHLPICRR